MWVLFVPVVILGFKTKFKEGFEGAADKFNWRLSLGLGIVAAAMLAAGEFMDFTVLCYVGVAFCVAIVMYLAKYMIVNGVVHR